MIVLTRSRVTIFVSVCILALLPPSAYADTTCDFEFGLGHNAQAIGSILGLVFSTTTGGGVLYADINSAWYSVTSDNGKVYEDGEYFVSGDVAAYVPNLSDRMMISFPYGTASYLTVGYSSQFQFLMEGYDGSGTLLTSATGPANVKSQGGTGLCYLTLSGSGMRYAILHDQGRYWMIDNITTDAVVPEPASLMVLLAGLGGLAALRRRS